MFEKPIDFNRFVRFLLLSAIVCGIYFFLKYLSSVLLPFFLAWLTAYLIYPLVTAVRRWIPNKKLSVFILLAVLLIIFALSSALLVPIAIDEIIRLKSIISSKMNEMELPVWVPQDVWESTLGYLSKFNFSDVVEQETMREQLFTAFSKIWESLNDLFGVLSSFFSIVTYLIYLIFILLDYESIAEGWKKYIPKKYQSFVFQLIEDVELSMNRYFRAQTSIVILVAILFSIGFKIIGLPFAIVFGIMLGLMNYIPYLQLAGIVPALILAALQAIETGSSFWFILGSVLLVFVVVQLIQDLYLTPKFMGKFSGFNPAVILLSLSVWGSLLGMIGLIIAIPLTSLLVTYYSRYLHKKELN